MDFGLSRFLEMFEERFGRVTTTLLLGVIGIAVFSYCTKIAIESSVFLYGILTSAPWIANLGPKEILIQIFVLAIQAGVAWILLWGLWRLYFIPKLNKVRGEASDFLDEVTAKATESVELAEKRSDEIMRRGDALLKELENLLDEVKSHAKTIVDIKKDR